MPLENLCFQKEQATRFPVGTMFSKGTCDTVIGLNIGDRTILLTQDQCDQDFFETFQQGELKIAWEGENGRRYGMKKAIYLRTEKDYKRVYTEDPSLPESLPLD